MNTFTLYISTDVIYGNEEDKLFKKLLDTLNECEDYGWSVLELTDLPNGKTKIDLVREGV